MNTPILLGSILLEPNRWTADKAPSLRVSDWAERAREAGFDGIELWENHYLRADATERARLQASPCPVLIFNSYAAFEPDDRVGRERAREAAGDLGATGVKFNLGADPAQTPYYLETIAFWAQAFPPSARLLCECHPGTVLETPEAAAKAFAAWTDARLQAIVHPFNAKSDALQMWLAALGNRITHAHVQTRTDNNQIVRLDRRAREVRSALALLKDHGFDGSFTVEFTEGTRTANDRPDVLWENAVADLQFLWEHWQ